MFFPAVCSFIINCLYDNSSSEVGACVKKIDGKLGGFKMAASGSVLFNFERKGRLAVNQVMTEDEVIEMAISAARQT